MNRRDVKGLNVTTGYEVPRNAGGPTGAYLKTDECELREALYAMNRAITRFAESELNIPETIRWSALAEEQRKRMFAARDAIFSIGEVFYGWKD